jgi:membrane fusion protein (multidrug efflux system)
MKRFFTFCLLTLIAYSCGEKKETKKAGGAQNNGPIKVEALIIKPSSLLNEIDIAGNILANEMTEIRPEISGRITQINFKEGTVVPKNTILVKLFDGDLQAQLKKLKVQLQIAEKTEERQKELLKINGISQQDYDLSLLQVNNIKADIELIQVSIAKTEILAPYAGRIGLRNVSLGAYINPSNILTTLSQVDKKKISFSIPEKYSADIRPGMGIQFKIEGSDKDFHANILASETVIESNTRNLKILATINESDPKLVPGSFAKVNLVLGTNKNAILVPSQSIIPSARSKQVILYKNGSPEFVNVKLGVRSAETVEITSGINQGDTLITTGLLFIRKDLKLKLTKIQ